MGAGAALAGGVGGVMLQQQGSGVTLELHGAKVGLEVSAESGRCYDYDELMMRSVRPVARSGAVDGG